MNKKTKLILLLGLGGVAVFFLLRKAQAAATEEAAAKPSVGNIVKALIPKAIKVVKGLLAGGGAVATTGAAAGGIGVTSGGGAVVSGITSGGAVSSGAAAGGGVSSGAATSLGSTLAAVGLLISPWILGPKLEKLLTKSQAEWEAQIKAKAIEDAAYKAASLKMAEDLAYHQRYLAETSPIGIIAETNI